MHLDFSNERVLAIVAHPDDAELLCAGTLARAKADGAAIGLCVLCRGDKGQPSRRIKNLAAVRRRELEAAARLLGAVVFHGGFGDGELADTYSARRVVIEIVRRFAPTLLLAHSPADYHADHRAASSLAEAASWFCASPGHKTASPSLPAPPALWWMDTVNMTGFEPVFFVNVTDYLDLKRNMLACHRSQMQRSGESGFGPLMEQMLLQATTRGAQAGVRAAEAFQPYAGWKRGRAW